VLFVNEAAINSAKHVFRPNRGHSFAVGLNGVAPRRVLTVHDDGPGFAATAANAAPGRYGHAVIRGLASQLGGVLELDDGPGAVIRLTF
jgi:two-component sensor histidine kinase